MVAFCIGAAIASAGEKAKTNQQVFKDVGFVCRMATQQTVASLVPQIELIGDHRYLITDDQGKRYFFDRAEFESCFVVPKALLSGNGT